MKRAARASGTIISLITALGVNLIPLEYWLDGSFSAASAMLYYLAENAIAVVFATVVVVIFGVPRGQRRERVDLIKGYLLTSVSFLVVCSIFIGFFLFGILKFQLSIAAVLSAAKWLLLFAALDFIGDSLRLPPLDIKKMGEYLSHSLGHICLLALCVLAGMFLALFADAWFLVPFVVLKTLVDLGEKLQAFRHLRFLKPRTAR